jgi:DinB superfamily/Pentapeptide repeats (8 copies)
MAMTEFYHQDLSGARFEEVDFSRAWFRNVSFVAATIRGGWFEDVDIDGEIRNVRINGVDVGPFVEAELDRRHPERTKLRPTDADGFREAWAVIEHAWPSIIERARRLPPELLHERVDDEWSFIETLRHLLFATDAWLLRAFLGRSDPTRRLTCRTPRWSQIRACPTTRTRGRHYARVARSRSNPGESETGDGGWPG